MDIRDLPDILDSLNEDQIKLMNQTVTESIKRVYLEGYIRRDIENEKIEGSELTYGEVFKTLTEEQRYALHIAIEMALNEVEKEIEWQE